LGDLPALYVDSNEKASLPILVPKLHVNNLQGLTLMIHANGDNYSDTPPLGGGGARVACGIISND
jgi:Cu-Zn family superoxide dismutase